MIKVIDDWYITIETNPTNYVVRRGKDERDAKGKRIDRPQGYFSGLRNAIKFIRDQIVADKLSSGLRTLEEALRTVSETDAHFEEIIKSFILFEFKKLFFIFI